MQGYGPARSHFSSVPDRHPLVVEDGGKAQMISHPAPQPPAPQPQPMQQQRQQQQYRQQKERQQAEAIVRGVLQLLAE